VTGATHGAKTDGNSAATGAETQNSVGVYKKLTLASGVHLSAASPSSGTQAISHGNYAIQEVDTIMEDSRDSGDFL
jgi:hypothetical protein